MSLRYRIVDTPCRPNRYKVEFIGCRDDNSPSCYHETMAKAHAWAMAHHYDLCGPTEPPHAR